MSSTQITSSSSPPLIASKTSHIQMAVPQPITKFMVSINQSGQTIMPVTSIIQQPPSSSIYVVGQAAASRIQYVSMGNIGSSMASNISFATNFDPPHSLTMPQKLASRIPLSKPRLAIPAQHLGDQRQFFSTDLKNPALLSPITSKNAPIISNLMPISKQITNVTASSIPNTSFISPTQQKLLLAQSRAANSTRNPLPASAISLSISQQKSLAISWSSASPSIIPITHLINKTSGHLHHEQLTQRAQGQLRPENPTLLLLTNHFPQQQPKMLSPILSGPINLSTQSNKNSVQSQALNLTINRQQQAIILTSTPASLRTSIPISTNLVINKLGPPITGLNLARPKKNIRLNPASTTTILNQHASVSSASKQAHTVVSIQPVSSQIVQQSQPHNNFAPIAKVTPQLHLFQQQQHQQQFQNQIFQNHHQSIQLFQSQQQLQNQQHLQNQQALQNQQLQNQQALQNQQLQSHQLQNQQQNLQLLQSQQQIQNQQALQSFHSPQQLQIQQTQQQKLQQQLLQQPKISTATSFNSSVTPIRLQNSQLVRMSETAQLQSPTSVGFSMIAAGLPFSLANEQNILQIDRSLALKGIGEEDSNSRLMHVSMEQFTNRSNHPLSNPIVHTVTQASIGIMVGQPNLSQTIHVQNAKALQQSIFTQSSVKLQPYYTNMDSPKAIVNFHVSAAPLAPEKVLLTSPIFHQQQHGCNDVIIKQQQLPPPQNSSPRPSILRKPVDVFVNPNIRKNLISHLSVSQNLEMLPQNDVPVIVTNTQITPIEIVRENSQSSTDTASPSEVLLKPNLKPNVHENGAFTNKMNSTCKLLPRKKPRKQSLHMCPDATEIGELIADDIVMADDDADIIADENEAAEADDENEHSDVLNDEKSNIEISINDSDMTEYVDKNGLRWTLEKKRPNITMSQQYHCSWKPKYNHFTSISDVKPKEEKRQTLNEIANQRNIQEKISGSKLYLIAAQFDQLRDGEQEMEQQLRKFKDSLLTNNENKFKLSDDELFNLEELIMSNIQRSQTCASQYDDVTDLLLKLVERKSKVSEILNKHQSKRTSKKKDKNNGF